MTSDQVLFNGIVHTEYGQFDLTWGADDVGFDGDVDRFFAGQVNGVAGAAVGDGLYINLARRSGGSQVTISLCSGEPTLNGDWEDIVEVTVTVPSGAQPRWPTWAAEETGALALPPGEYRVRVSARGRDAGAAGEFEDTLVDFYLVEFWPADDQPDAVVRVGSADATYWHREVGGRR